MQSILLPAASLQIWIEKRARGAPAFRAARVLQTRRAAIDRHRLPLPAESTAANPPHAADRRTDGRTADSCIDYAPHTARAVPINAIFTKFVDTSRHEVARGHCDRRPRHCCMSHSDESSFGKRSFSTAAPSVWNSLPVSFQNCDTLTLFKSRLKAHLFSSVYAS